MDKENKKKHWSYYKEVRGNIYLVYVHYGPRSPPWKIMWFHKAKANEGLTFANQKQKQRPPPNRLP